MKYILLMCLALALSSTGNAQIQVTVTVRAAGEGTPLAGATVSFNNSIAAATDNAGIASFTSLSTGSYRLQISHIGFATLDTTLVISPTNNRFSFELEGEAEKEEEEEVIVSTTRASRTIANTPTRVEVISGEELAEKGNMKPGDIRMLLSETTGIQVQQTSATSYNAGIRIQGLEGRYTQLLRDGYPLYAGFAGGLSILQIAPLDLQQVEVIKGSASTLYGGGAIAGLVNLVSKTPGDNRELLFLANATTAGGLDLSGFYSERYGKTGLTFFGSRNSTAAFDPAGIGLTAIPKSARYTIHPRFFVYGDRTQADIGLSFITENRIGGNTSFIKNGGAGFFERNNSDRITTTAGLRHRLSERSFLQLKNSYTRFNRSISIPAYRFDALQQSSFSEFTWNHNRDQSNWVIGANVLTDDLREKDPVDMPRDYHFNTYGVFAQHTWSANPWLTLETGLRGDYVTDYDFELLPRLSALFRLSPSLTMRLGGGFGYKTPTIYTEEAERLYFVNVGPVNTSSTVQERSVGGNWDINYRTSIGALEVAVNQLFFYTRLNNPIDLVPGNPSFFYNSPGYIDTRGAETNLRFLFGDFKLFFGYTFTDARENSSGLNRTLPLTAKHRLNNVLMYEVEEKWKLGLEAYYFSPQQLTDGTIGRSYWITGFMAEKLWERFSVFINFENFTNTRQSRFGPIYTGSIDNPRFRDIYAPVEGFVTNGGFKLRF